MSWNMWSWDWVQICIYRVGTKCSWRYPLTRKQHQSWRILQGVSVPLCMQVVMPHHYKGGRGRGLLPEGERGEGFLAGNEQLSKFILSLSKPSAGVKLQAHPLHLFCELHLQWKPGYTCIPQSLLTWDQSKVDFCHKIIFDCNTMFKVLYRWTSVKDEARAHCVNVGCISKACMSPTLHCTNSVIQCFQHT